MPGGSPSGQIGYSRGMDNEILARAAEGSSRGEAAVLVTLVAVDGPAPREPGARMLVFADGRTEGTIGGGALELTAVAEARALLGRGERTHLATHELTDRGLRCGGGRVTLFYEALTPAYQVVIFGAGHVGRVLARLVQETAAFPIVVYDEREERCGELARGLIVCHLPGYGSFPLLSPNMYVVICTDSHENDFRVALQVFSQTPGPAYIGMLGSARKSEEIRERLREAGISPERVATVRCPVGLPIGGRDPGAVAVSILAELVAFHHGRLAEAQARLEGGRS